MILDLNRLNALEKEIYNTLTVFMKQNGPLKITEAAALCDCSTSKISKFVKKLGFDTFKQFTNFTQGELPAPSAASSELERIRQFTDNFDHSMVDNFLLTMYKYDRIILLGYGPSYYCAEYLEYKLRIHTTKNIIAVPDIVTAQSQLRENTLLIIFSVTGKFASFNDIYNETKALNGEVLLLIEEYAPDLLNNYENIYFLTSSNQDSSLKPYEKSRVLFFIFLEEVIFELRRRQNDGDKTEIIQ